MRVQVGNIFTVSQIAAKLGKPRHHVLYILDTCGINASGIVGNARVYTRDDADRVREESRRIDSQRLQGVADAD